MSSIAKLFFATLALSLLATAFSGCGSGNKEGAPLVVTKVGDTQCIQCHSSVVEALTGESIVAQYQRSSPHNTPELGCESCHGGGAMHNGVGPIPFPRPDANRCATCHNGRTATATNANTDFETSNHVTGTPRFTTSYCYRCHTNEGAVLGNIAGWTGNTEILQDPVTQGKVPLVTTFTGFDCETCHEHGGGLRPIKATDAPAGNLVNWDPNNNKLVDQFDLCTSCHTLYNYNGTLLLVNGQNLDAGGVIIPTGRIAARHETEWFRMIASTHFDNPNTGPTLTPNVIEGYNLRRTGDSPCYDCHGHEAKTETNPSSTDTTIHKQWAQSGHAGGLLTAKYTATQDASGIPLPNNATTVALAMNAGATGTAWNNRNWDATSNGSCQVCHTTTGNSNYLTNQNTTLTGYDPANNNFSYLTGGQNELLYCWGCHSNAGTGALRNTSQAILTYTFEDEPIVITGAGKSTACIVCHGGRGSVTDAIISDDRSARFQGHHAPTAGIIYNEQTHVAYEYPGLSYVNPAIYVHDNIGSGASGSGPCASCHMPSENHTFQAVELDAGGVPITISNQALCNTCHSPGPLTPAVSPASLVSLKAAYNQTSTLLNNYVNNLPGFENYLGFAIDEDNFDDTVLVPNNAYGAFQNGKLNGEEPCAYVHNSIYTRRLLFDSIDWMNNGVLNGIITIDATAFPGAAVWYGAPVGTIGPFIASRP